MTKSTGVGRGGPRKGAGRPKGEWGKSFTKEQCDRLRAKIQTDKIIQRLNEFVTQGKDMPPAAVTAGLGLLRKVIPDLASVEHSGDVTTHYVAEVPAQASDADQWQSQHVPAQHKTLQ